MDRRQVDALQRLAALSAMKREAELAKLAAVARSRNRLKSALATLKTTEAPLQGSDEEGNGAGVDPAMVAARLAHRRWIENRQSRLNQQLAAITADWLRQRPAAAKAFGRAEVMETLRDRARTAYREARDKER
ncbi:hypothetical protein JI664_06835 [Rhodobacter sp. NTK016B]|uniref:hypothetical protein n=1 Tax=Rhodobacter sp. NTK016B TaxID=2759676 RepID=UPI001A8C43DA|nr:hypothetical protein [Rhodobacter sp. NTK016B]MBN8291673.1 hypothetical protein [Rhodobacter sp. NTK016B]